MKNYKTSMENVLQENFLCNNVYIYIFLER